ncbi:InlB B-repeat-containing protein [Leucobacter luti]|uniref:InlB B-repeat-containing protein n=1 Tax=Leucobacter luti TaxID=340320 RepID=UPI003D067272
METTIWDRSGGGRPRFGLRRALRAVGRAALAAVLVAGAAGVSVAAAPAANAAPGDPEIPYNITFVWHLGPNSAPGSEFNDPQTYVASGSDANDPGFVPPFDRGCGWYQIDRYRITNAEEQALIDGLRESGIMTSNVDEKIGVNWSNANGGGEFWTYEQGGTDCAPAPVAPAVTQAVCTAPGQATLPQVILPETTGIDYALEGEVAQGSTVTVTATPREGFTLSPADGWTLHPDGTATWTTTLDSVDCAERVAPTAPAVTQAVCSAPGQATVPTVTLPETPGVSYALSGDVVAGGTVTVTATPDAGYALTEAQGWILHPDGTATWTTTLANVDCTEHVAPVQPAVTQAVCAAPGKATAPVVTLTETAGIAYELAGTVAAGQTVTVTARSAAGYALTAADGWTLAADGSATATIRLASVDCSSGSHPSQPRGHLATTGADVGSASMAGLAGIALLAAGGGALALAKRRRRS